MAVVAGALGRLLGIRTDAELGLSDAVSKANNAMQQMFALALQQAAHLSQ